MEDGERLVAVLAIRAGFADAAAVRLGAALGGGLLPHLERAGAISAAQRDLLLAFAAEASACWGGAGAALQALLDRRDPLPEHASGAAPPAIALPSLDDGDEPALARLPRPK